MFACRPVPDGGLLASLKDRQMRRPEDEASPRICRFVKLFSGRASYGTNIICYPLRVDFRQFQLRELTKGFDVWVPGHKFQESLARASLIHR